MGTNGHVTLDSLWRTKLPLTLGEETVWVRVLSDLDLQARDEHAILAMVRRRRVLETPGTREHELYVESLDAAPDADLRTILGMAAQADLVREALRTIRTQVLPFPEEATDEEKARVIGERLAEDKRSQEERDAWVKEKLTAAQKGFVEMDRETLLASAREKQLETQGRLASSRGFQDYSIYAATYHDAACLERRFGSPEEVSQLPTEVRNTLLDFYFSKVDTIRPLDLQRFQSTAGSESSSRPGTPSAEAMPVVVPPAPETSPGGTPPP